MWTVEHERDLLSGARNVCHRLRCWTSVLTSPSNFNYIIPRAMCWSRLSYSCHRVERTLQENISMQTILILPRGFHIKFHHPRHHLVLPPSHRSQKLLCCTFIADKLRHLIILFRLPPFSSRSLLSFSTSIHLECTRRPTTCLRLRATTSHHRHTIVLWLWTKWSRGSGRTCIHSKPTTTIRVMS